MSENLSQFFTEMAKLYNPKVIPGLKAIIQFNLDENFYYLDISGKECKASKGTHTKPNLTINSPIDVWTKISTGELDGTKAFLKKLFQYKGDMNLLLKMTSMFSREEIIEKPKKESEILLKKFEKIPDHRGPLKISGVVWLNLMMIPWILLFIWGGFVWQDILPRIVAVIIAVVITLYHIITNRPTWFEIFSCIYFIISMMLYALGSMFFMGYQAVINYIIIAGLWLGSLMKQFSLTALYSRTSYPKEVWITRQFLDTNRIITGVWGLYFLLAAITNLITVAYSQYPEYGGFVLVVILIPIVSLIPMFAFTSWFQKWYPAKLTED